MPYVRFLTPFVMLLALLSGGQAGAQEGVIATQTKCKEDETDRRQIPSASQQLEELESILRETQKVTFDELIAPILKRSCKKCHNSSEDAEAGHLPFIDAKGEANYDLVKKFSWTITGQVMQDLMPPEGEPRLTEAEKLYFKNWTLAGAPRGQAVAALTPVPGEAAGPGKKDAPPCKGVNREGDKSVPPESKVVGQGESSGGADAPR